MSTYKQNDKDTIQHDIINHVEYTLAKTRFDFTSFHCYQAVSLSVRDRLIESFNDTAEFFIHNDVKFLYYLSLEFLVGRFLQNALVNLELEQQFKEALEDFGFSLEKIYEEEYDAALGNGGLGRLAACFLDSFATLNLPAWGYGIRYNYGIFRQFIRDGYQCEAPDFWLDKGNPWEIERLDLNYPIRFYGHVRRTREHNKDLHFWEGGQIVIARGYDNPIPGYNTFNTINLRLWRSLPNNEFDFSSFNQGDYFRALEERQRAEYITSVLYPNDSTYAGKELRLKQQYLLVSASIADAVRRFMMKKNREWKDWPEKVMCQLNDTHPAMAIVELLRVLLDIELFDIETAWDITYKSFGYTNHTILPEALEKWGVDLIGNLLPRHLELIFCINQRFMDSVAFKYPYDASRLQRMSIIEEGHNQKVRMANLCIVGSRFVNGVAEIHSDILKATLFKDFCEMKPAKFQNKTNGVTPRRWLKCCNPKLAQWLDKNTGCEDWILDMDKLKKFTKVADDAKAQAEFIAIKRENKQKLINLVKGACNGVELILDSIFDIQVKRIHEYKRQLLNLLYIIYRYICILKTPW
jgi:starch phosphorylase